MTLTTKITIGFGFAIVLLSAVEYFNQPTPGASNNTVSTNLEARLATARPLKPFQLMTHDQKPLDLGRLKNKWTLLFLGYTHCPDVCPTTLTELANMAQQLSPAIIKDTQFIFVSVDPERDSPDSLAEYVRYFNQEFIGATGNVEALTTLTQQLDSKFSLETDPAGEPIVNHSSAMLLIDPQVRYYARFKAPHYAEEIHAQYLALRDDYLHKQSVIAPVSP